MWQICILILFTKTTIIEISEFTVYDSYDPYYIILLSKSSSSGLSIAVISLLDATSCDKYDS